jgi:hypothetical protein
MPRSGCSTPRASGRRSKRPRGPLLLVVSSDIYTAVAPDDPGPGPVSLPASLPHRSPATSTRAGSTFPDKPPENRRKKPGDLSGGDSLGAPRLRARISACSGGAGGLRAEVRADTAVSQERPMMMSAGTGRRTRPAGMTG